MPNQTITVSVDVTNTGNVVGKEIVQLYVRDVKSTFARPEKELKAFEKVEIKPKQTKTVAFTLDREAFWYFDAAKASWSTEPGEYEILVGASSRDIREKHSVFLEHERRVSRLHTGSTMTTLMGDSNARAILSKHISGFLFTDYMTVVGDSTLEQVASKYPDLVSKHTLTQIENELAMIE